MHGTPDVVFSSHVLLYSLLVQQKVRGDFWGSESGMDGLCEQSAEDSTLELTLFMLVSLDTFVSQ